MDNQNKKQQMTYVWEISVPMTVTIVSRHDVSYPEARRLLGEIPQEDLYKAFKRAYKEFKEKYIHPVIRNDEHLEEGVYLRKLTYNEMYRDEQTPEIPIPVVWDENKK